MGIREIVRRALWVCVVCACALVSCGSASATTVTGTFKVNNQPFSGYITVQLNYPGITGQYTNLPVPSAPISVLNGTFAALTLDGNDTMLPKHTYYSFSVFDQYGAYVTRLNYYVSGSTFDIGQAVPTPVLTNNLSFIDLVGLRSVQASAAAFSTMSTGFNAVYRCTTSGALPVGALTINTANCGTSTNTGVSVF